MRSAYSMKHARSLLKVARISVWGKICPPLRAMRTLSCIISKFTKWNSAEGVEKGSPAHYSKQHYTQGAKCWNGPQRSVTVSVVLLCYPFIISYAYPLSVGDELWPGECRAFCCRA